MNSINDYWILENGEDCIPYDQFRDLAESVRQMYHFSPPIFWMWKMFQFGFAYGKHEARKNRRYAR